MLLGEPSRAPIRCQKRRRSSSSSSGPRAWGRGGCGADSAVDTPRIGGAPARNRCRDARARVPNTLSVISAVHVATAIPTRKPPARIPTSPATTTLAARTEATTHTIESTALVDFNRWSIRSYRSFLLYSSTAASASSVAFRSGALTSAANGARPRRSAETSVAKSARSRSDLSSNASVSGSAIRRPFLFTGHPRGVFQIGDTVLQVRKLK
jgi:hypothetical protein